MTVTGAGHRNVPHTADVCIEAWAPTREECIAQAVRGAVETFVDLVGVTVEGQRTAELEEGPAEDLLVGVLDEMVYLLDAAGEVPVETVVGTPHGGRVDVRFGVADAGRLEQVGAVPKAVSLHGLRMEHGSEGWTCSVILDV